jgi:acyl-CoA reductase-like NAD-dependent aldehyde dehydrogenase
MAAKRIIVERGIWDAFRPHLAREVGRLVLGDPGREETDVGPFSGPGAGWARTALAEALALGGEVVVGEGERGPFFTPTVVLLPHDARETLLWREESFAPLRGLMLAEGPEEAVALANDSPFGLGAAVFGGAGAARVAAGVRAARVVINESPLYADPHLVVGGVGDSGFGGARPKLEQLVYARRVHRGGSGA